MGFEGKHLTKGSPLPVFPNDGKLRLYSMRFCAYAHRIHLMLEAKKIPYHTSLINLTDRPEWLWSKSPLGKVPALEIPKSKSDPLIESLIIAEYLEERYRRYPMHSKDPIRRAQDRILVDRFGKVIRLIYKIAFGNGGSEAIQKLLSALELYEKELKDRGMRFFHADQPGYLDYMIWPFFERMAAFPEAVGVGMDSKRFWRLLEWAERMKDEPAVRKLFLKPEHHFRYIKTMAEGNPDYDMLVTKSKL